MKQVLLVFVGGGIGSVIRYLIGSFFSSSSTEFPWGTFSVNIIGSLFIGIFMGIALENDFLSENQTLLLATGFCGGFTTFSTFAYENHVLFKSGDFISFALYTFTSFIIAFLAVFAGMYLSRMLS